MKIIFKSYGLWDLVKKGFDSTKMKEADESDAKKKEKEGSSGARKMILTETLMKDAKALGLIRGAVQMQNFPEFLTKKPQKEHGAFYSKNTMVINSLPSAYDSICSVIEHSKDLDVIEVQEVVASLKSFELRLDRHSENKTEKAFASLSVNPKSDKPTGS
ncbi:unnamed protein product [Prunus brigantina]